MSITRRIFFGAAAAWFSRGLTILLGLVLMPVLFRTLGKEELGLWLLLGQSAAVLGILDFGFGVTLTRRIAFAKGKSGSHPGALLSEESSSEIADLVSTGLFLYRLLALVAFAVSLGLGFIYLHSIEIETISVSTVWFAWAVLCLSQALTVWATPWTCLIQGVGHVGWDAIIASFTGALSLIAQIVVALCGGGILALAITAAIGALLQRSTILTIARWKQPDLFALRGRWRQDLFREMAPLAWRAWLTALGSALILYTDQFVIASREGTTELPAYRAAWVLMHNLTIVAVTFATASGVFVSQLWQDGDRSQIHRLLDRNLRFAWLVMSAGAAVLLFAGKSVFDLWLGPGNFIGYPILIAFLVIEALEAQTYVIGTTSRATGDEPFAWSFLTAGLLKLFLSIVLAKVYGLLGIALGTLVALTLTNHWYVPLRGLARLEYPTFAWIRHTILPCFLWFGGMCAALLGVGQLTTNTPAWVHLCVAALTTSLLFCVALWTLVLEPAQRDRFLQFTSSMRRTP
jgi:O-antigen/teichoic acid export membrane protein